MTPVWLADWSDEEQAAFTAAAPGTRVLRSRPLGTTVGGAAHRLRSWPAYAGLALRGAVLGARGEPVVAWQPLAGALTGLLPRTGRGGALVVLNPILDGAGPDAPPDQAAQTAQTAGGPLRRLTLAGLRRADGVVVYSRRAADALVAAGVPADRVRFVALGTAPRAVTPPDPHAPLLAAGRDHRDWEVLAEAARLTGLEVLVAGPDHVPAPLRLVRPGGRAAFHRLVQESRAVVVPLLDDRRQAGTLAVLDAFAAGRAVVATRGPGTEDYVDDAVGALVPVADPAALAEALRSCADAPRLAAWSLAAGRRGQELTLDSFVAQVHVFAAELDDRRHRPRRPHRS